MALNPQTRRHFLKVLAVSAAVPALGACGSSTGPAPIGDVAAGTVAALPVGTLRVVTGASAAIGRDAGGVYAMTLTCTHEGCDIASTGTVSSAGIACSCHGSRFDANGAVVNGPATAPLQHFLVSASGNLTIHGGTNVDASTRLAV